MRLGIRDFTAKSGRDSGLKVCARGGMTKITLGITGLLEISGRDYEIEKPYWGPCGDRRTWPLSERFNQKSMYGLSAKKMWPL